MAMNVKEPLRPLTYDDLSAYEDDASHRREIVAGSLVVSSAPALDHGQVVLAILDAFRPIIQAGGLGRIWATPADVELDHHNVVQPDLFFIVRDRLTIAKHHVVGSPDLAVEVVDPPSQTRDYVVKRVIYEAAGINEYWIVDPTRRSIRVLVLNEGRYVQQDNADGIARSIVVPGVEVEIVQLFDAAVGCSGSH